MLNSRRVPSEWFGEEDSLGQSAGERAKGVVRDPADLDKTSVFSYIAIQLERLVCTSLYPSLGYTLSAVEPACVSSN